MMPDTASHRPVIAMIVPTFGRVGGAENLVVELCDCLHREHGMVIEVLAHRFETTIEGIHPHRIPIWPFPKWMRPYSFAWGVERALRRIPHDLVHSHERIFCADVFSIHGMPHHLWIRDVRRKSMSLFDRATARVERTGYTHPETRLLLPVSRLVGQAVIDTYPGIRERVQVLHPGVAARRFATCHQSEVKAAAKVAFGLSPSDTVLLFVGMNFEVKRLQLVMEALATLGRPTLEAQKLKLLVIGKGDIARYNRLAAELGIAKNVCFAGVQTDMVRSYAAGDVFVMPSRMDTFGLVVLEALAAGLPVILSERVGAVDVVRKAGCGIVLEADPDQAVLAEVISEMLDVDRRTLMGRSAHTLASSYDWQTVTSRLVRHYESLLQQRKRSGS